MQRCLKLKEEGNTLLKSKRYSEAMNLYAQSLRHFEQLIDQDKIQTEDDMIDIIRQVKIPCMKNTSLCLLKLNRPQECIDKCDEILKLEPDCPKTNYRKAAAMLEQNRVDEAQAILKDCYFKYPNQVEFQMQLEDIEVKKQKLKEREEAKKKAETEWNRFIARWLLFFMLPILILWKLVFKKEPPLYNRIDSWANGKTLKLL